MKYLDNQHKILKYLCKLKYGVTKAHKKCLIPSGEDYEKLKTNERVYHKDAVVDINKLRDLFDIKKIVSKEDFDIALSELISLKYLTEDYVVTSGGENINKKVFKDYYSEPAFKEMIIKDGIDETKLLFND